jgi:hypothetical protein
MIKVLLFSLACIILTGCGHNGLIYTKGDLFNIGYTPQTQTGGIQWLSGESVSIGNRENTSLDIYMSDNSGAEMNTGSSAKKGNIARIRYSTGIQINGYTTKLAESNPDFAAKLLAEMYKEGQVTRYYLVKNNNLVEVTQEEYLEAAKGSTRVMYDPKEKKLNTEIVK